MKVIVAGSRDFTNYKVVNDAVYASPWLLKITEIVSGGADGVDSMGELFAENHLLRMTRFNAEWSEQGRAAGPIRNRKMADYADALVAVWDGKSPGTRDMIAQMIGKGKPVFVYPARHMIDDGPRTR